MLHEESQAHFLNVRRRIMAALETGNVNAARTAYTEYAETNPIEARSLQADVVKSYNISL